jgi:hypothetical protein
MSLIVNLFFIFNLSNYTDKDIDALIRIDKRYIVIKEIIHNAQNVYVLQKFEDTIKEYCAIKDLLKIIHRNIILRPNSMRHSR